MENLCQLTYTVNKTLYKNPIKDENGNIFRIEKPTVFKLLFCNSQEMKANGELEGFMFDTSYREHWDKLRSHGFPVSKYPIFNCTGGGRCFNADFTGNVNPELSELIRKYESK